MLIVIMIGNCILAYVKDIVNIEKGKVLHNK